MHPINWVSQSAMKCNSGTKIANEIGIERN